VRISSKRLPRWFVAIVVLGTVGRLGAQPKSEEEWKQLAEKGSAEEKRRLAQSYDSVLRAFWVSVPISDGEAAKWYSKAADQGDTASMTSLASMYLTGRGVEKSLDKRIQLLRRAAQLGDVWAMSSLASDYFGGSNGLAEDRVMGYALMDVQVREVRCVVTNRNREVEEAQTAASVSEADTAVPDYVLRSSPEVRDKWLEVRKERIEELKKNIDHQKGNFGSARKELDLWVGIRATFRKLVTESALASATKLADQLEGDLKDSFHSACLAPEGLGSVSSQRAHSAMSGTSESASVAIERIRTARYAPMPEPKVFPGASGTSLAVENRTNLVINLYLKGPTTHSLNMAPSSSATLTLTAGRYEVAAEIPDSSTVPFYAEQTFNAETNYQQVFLMSESKAGAKPPALPPITGSRPIAPAPAQESLESAQQTGTPSDSQQVFDAIDGQVSVSRAGVQFRNLHKPKDSFTLTCAEILIAAPGTAITSALKKNVVYIKTSARFYTFQVPGDPATLTRAMKNACPSR
jgi:hypothetical protein